MVAAKLCFKLGLYLVQISFQICVQICVRAGTTNVLRFGLGGIR